jgi:hypothetical protein
MTPPKRTTDFTAEERAVIRERARYQDNDTLAAVFGTTARVIANIRKYA